jgi:DNA-directed RNA polymerase subunit beta'
LVDVDMTKKAISRLINHSYRTLGIKATVVFADKLMYLVFPTQLDAGVSFGVDDMAIPMGKEDIISCCRS